MNTIRWIVVMASAWQVYFFCACAYAGIVHLRKQCITLHTITAAQTIRTRTLLDSSYSKTCTQDLVHRGLFQKREILAPGARFSCQHSEAPCRRKLQRWQELLERRCLWLSTCMSGCVQSVTRRR